MITTQVKTQDEFYREFLMTRGKFDPAEFGVNLSREDFTDQMVEAFHGTYRDGWTIDELLLHPREAVRFCDDVRRKHGYYDVPDDIILRVILTRRKNP
ncbi:MAG: hypothetical protein ABIP48_31825 [Planctomycetota bacterium]